jgi:hypothetical protein
MPGRGSPAVVRRVPHGSAAYPSDASVRSRRRRVRRTSNGGETAPRWALRRPWQTQDGVARLDNDRTPSAAVERSTALRVPAGPAWRCPPIVHRPARPPWPRRHHAERRARWRVASSRLLAVNNRPADGDDGQARAAQRALGPEWRLSDTKPPARATSPLVVDDPLLTLALSVSMVRCWSGSSRPGSGQRGVGRPRPKIEIRTPARATEAVSGLRQ